MNRVYFKAPLIVVLIIFLVGCSMQNQDQIKKDNSGTLIFISDRDSDTRNLYSVSIDGTNLKIINTNTIMNNNFSVSRDEQNVIFEGAKSITDLGQIFSLNLKTNEVNRITKLNKSILYSSPKWSSNSNFIYYMRTVGADKFYSLIKLNMEKNQETKVLDNLPSPRFSIFNNQFIVYESSLEKPNLLLKNMVTGGVINLTNGKDKNFNPAFSHDGKKIAFISTRDDNSEVYIIDVTGKNVQRITSNNYVDDFPQWSPDDKKIIYTSYKKSIFDGGELIVVDLETKKEWNVTKTVERKDKTFTNDTNAMWLAN